MTESTAGSVAASLPVIELRQIVQRFPEGEGEVEVLKGVDLRIVPGEMLAIVGASGSGKSTMLNILGCLLRPTSGNYQAFGQDIMSLDDDALADLRSRHFGFIFQRYQLLSGLSVAGNVEMPAIYAGLSHDERSARARELLCQLGIADYVGRLPNQLSGGQQQRVGIARALMNGGDVILADEPTGALDSKTGREVVEALVELNRLGHTVILVTHDMALAKYTRRIVEMQDGRIVRDEPVEDGVASDSGARQATRQTSRIGERSVFSWPRLGEALRMALHAMAAHRLRSALTMLGVVIGIASVVFVVAFGDGTREAVIGNISEMSNQISIMPGNVRQDTKVAQRKTLFPGDVDALNEQFFVDVATPVVTSFALLRYRNREIQGDITGAGVAHLRVQPRPLEEGSWFNEQDVHYQSQVVVIDANVRDALFPNGEAALGKVILVGKLPCTVIGVASKKQSVHEGQREASTWVPYTVLLGRVLGQAHLGQILVRTAEGFSTQAAQQGIENVLSRRHGAKDFRTIDTAFGLEQFDSLLRSVTTSMSVIALISLVVGGIGIMNTMLVSVSERTREIGIRRAVGARQADIRDQFLIESGVICLVGGCIGVVLAFVFTGISSWLLPKYPPHISFWVLALAVAFSAAIGLIFGYMPARNASRLDPCSALAYE